MDALNDQYKLETKIDNNCLQISVQDGKNKSEYTGLFSKEFLSEKEELFKFFQLDAILNFFNEIIKSKKYKINLDSIKLNLIIEYTKDKKFDLIIPKKELNEKTQLNIITELANENKEIKERLSELEKKVNKLLNEKENKDDLKGFENTIIKNKSEANKILKWVCPNNERKVKLLYKATLEENTNDDFHRKCDNKGATVTLIETTKGRRFGAYTSLSWSSNEGWKDDKEAFLFSLDNDKKYDVIQDAKYKVYSGKGHGPWFGYNGNIGLAREKNYFIGNDTHWENFGDKCYSTTVENELSGGTKFNISKMEVYQILTDN